MFEGAYVETLAQDVLQQFCTSRGTQRIFQRWREDPRRTLVAPVVLGHRVSKLYELDADDVTEVCERTEHALGNVQRGDGEAVRAIVDWHPDFAFTHMFHVCMERRASLPTYEEFREFTDGDQLGWQMLGTPSRRKVHEVIDSGVPDSLARAAMRWRVGNAYYSFLREVYTVVELRGRGVDLRVHPLADALFRVDSWVGRKALSLRVGNKKFREGEQFGRKTPAEEILADILPPLQFESIELRPATVFGRVHLPSSGHLDTAAATLLSRQ